MARPILAILGFLGVVLFPAWVVICIMILLSLRYRAGEIALMGLSMDFVWQNSALYAGIPLFLIASLVILWACEPIRYALLLD